MNIKTSAFKIGAMALMFAGLAGCVSPLVEKFTYRPPPTAPVAPSRATTLDSYKRDLAQRIVAANPGDVYTGRPQALLRAVIVLKFFVDAEGRLVRTEILRSNKDRAAEAVALSAVKNAAPFPRPESHLLRRGEVEVSESWLFNNDGRFQLRSIADAQMDE